jgi:hypothetical protein
MQIKRCALTVSIGSVLFSVISPSAAQEVGVTYQGNVPIYDVQNSNIVYEIPLPEGKWFVRNVVNRDSTGNTASNLKDVRLALIEGGKLLHSLEITAKVNRNEMRWNDEPCKIEPILYKNDYKTALWKQKCMTIVPQAFLQSDNETTRLFLKTLADRNVKHDFNSIVSTYTRYGDFGKFLTIKLHTFPSNYGLENPLIGSVNTSPYHPSRIGLNKNKKDFVETLAKYSETLTKWYDLAYEGNKFNQLPRFKYSEVEAGLSNDIKDKLTLLEKSLEAKLITQAEFNQKKSEVLKDASQP